MFSTAQTSSGGVLASQPLSSLRIGDNAEVLSVREPGAVGERLLEMGLTPGTPVCLVRRGVFGQVLQLQVRDYMLSIRNEQAANIDVRSF